MPIGESPKAGLLSWTGGNLPVFGTWRSLRRKRAMPPGARRCFVRIRPFGRDSPCARRGTRYGTLASTGIFPLPCGDRQTLGAVRPCTIARRTSRSFLARLALGAGAGDQGTSDGRWTIHVSGSLGAAESCLSSLDRAHRANPGCCGTDRNARDGSASGTTC